MHDRDKVIKAIEDCVFHNHDCVGCDYDGYVFKYGDCRRDLLADALALLKEDCHNCKLECLLQKYDELKEKYDALLKEQEAVVPGKGHSGSGITWWNVCGNCKTAINPNDKYCHECGRAVKWNE